MSTVNMKALNKLTDAATATFDKWKIAGAYALSQHSGYVAALKANETAWNAAEAVRGFCNTVLTELHSDPDTDPSWFTKIGKIRDGAIYQVTTLETSKALVLADLAAHMKLSFSPEEAAGFTTELGAAAAADDKQQRGHPNPNGQDPAAQDSALPPVDAPPVAPETPWGMIALAGAGALLVLKLVWR